MDLARVGLDYDPVGARTLTLAYGGAFNASLWSRDGGGVWTEEDAVAGQHIGSAYAFERDSAGDVQQFLLTVQEAQLTAVT